MAASRARARTSWCRRWSERACGSCLRIPAARRWRSTRRSRARRSSATSCAATSRRAAPACFRTWRCQSALSPRAHTALAVLQVDSPMHGTFSSEMSACKMLAGYFSACCGLDKQRRRAGRDLCGGGLWQGDGGGGRVHRHVGPGRDQPGHRPSRRAAGLGAHGSHHGPGAALSSRKPVLCLWRLNSMNFVVAGPAGRA